MFSYEILLNIFDDREFGFAANFNDCFSSVTSLISTRLRIFHSVLPNTELFITLKKSFSNELLA